MNLSFAINIDQKAPNTLPEAVIFTVV